MKTFHVQLPFQAATDSYPIHRAGSSNPEGNYMLKVTIETLEQDVNNV